MDDMYEVAKYFLNNEQEVHLDLTSGKWLNGVIINLESDRLILRERVLGVMPVFLCRVISIVPARSSNDQ